MFNRLIGTHRSIVTDIAGTTRDIVTEIIDMGHSMVSVSDSPGLDHFDEEMVYIRKLIADSDYLLFVIDYTIGLTSKEHDIVREIRKAGREDQTLLVINKADKWMTQDQKEIVMSEYWSLGLASIMMISAKNGAHIDELEDMIA